MRRFLGVALLSALFPLSAAAATFTVNNLGDAPDVAIDGTCATAAGACTLRAAIVESNATVGTIDSIRFSVTGTIAPATPLPPITDRVFIDGGTPAGSPPDVIIDGGGTIPVGLEIAPGGGATGVAALTVRGFVDAGIRAATSVAVSQSHIGAVTGGTQNGYGIHITGGVAQIGGSGPADLFNVISGNNVGIVVDGARAIIMNTRIGTSPDGTAAVPNQIGVVISGGPFSTIGNATLPNVISGNLLDGIQVNGGATDLEIAGNRIGTNLAGTAALANGQFGINVINGIRTAIGSPTASNLVSGNIDAGIFDGGTQTSVSNTWVGLDLAGTTAIPNLYGIVVAGTNARVGVVDRPRNVVSGNVFDGIEILSSAVTPMIVNSYVGTNAAGTASVPNGGDGIFGNSVTGATIGLTTGTGSNVLSGNGRNGIAGNFTDSTIRDNRVGTNAAGDAAIPNAENGMLLEGTNVTVSSNVVSGNTADGIRLGRPNLLVESGVRASGTGASITSSSVTGNWVGTDSAGNAAVPNGAAGIHVDGTVPIFNVAASAGPGALVASGILISGNLISGNAGPGVLIDGAASNIEVVSNTIGRSDSNAPLPNQLEGVRVADTATGIVIGRPGEGNTIASNVALNGAVLVIDNAQASIRANHIFDNGGLGIDLLGEGITANDPLDPDAGPNMVQNAPTVTSATSEPFGSFIEGTVNSTPLTSLTIDAFSNTAPDPSGFGEGERYVGSTTVTTDAAGNASFTVTGPSVPAGRFVTATATASTGTSEFSGPLAAAAVPTVELSAASYTVAENGASVTVTVTRTGTTTGTSTVAYATSNSTATAGSDYTASSGTLTFAPGVTSQTFNVPILDDGITEGNETFTVTLSAPVAATLGTITAATVTVTDNETSSLSIGDVTLAEGNAGTTAFVFTVTLSTPSATAVTVDYATADQTATAGSDYASTSGTLTFAPGDLSRTVTVNVTGDTTFEPDETFVVNLAGAVGAAVPDPQAVGTITNDDAAGADVSITKSGPATAGALANATWTIVVANAGPDAATAVTITDVLPAGTTFVSATATQGTCSGTTTQTCSIGVLASGATATITLVARTPNTTGVMTNTATVSAAEDITPANNSASVTTNVIAGIPTLSEWMLIALAMALAGLAVLRIRA